MSWLATIWLCFAAFWQDLFAVDDAIMTPTICLDAQRHPYAIGAGAMLRGDQIEAATTLRDKRAASAVDEGDSDLSDSPSPSLSPSGTSPSLGLSSLPRPIKRHSFATPHRAGEPFLAGVAMTTTPTQRTLYAFWELLQQINAQYDLFRRYARSQGHLNGVGVPTPERLGQFFLETGEGSPALRYAVARELLRYHPHAAATRQFWEHLTLAGASLRP